VKVRTLLAVTLALVTRAASGQPTVVLSAGDPAPIGLPFSTFSDVALDDRGGVAFIGTSSGIFRGAGGSIPHLVVAGDTLGDGSVVAGVGPPALAVDGCVSYRAFLVGGGDGIFRQCDGPPAAVVRRGDTAPGGGTYVSFSPTVAVSGTVIAFGATLDDGTSALFSAASGTVSVVVRTGSPSPSGGTFSTLKLVGVSANGHVGFHGVVLDGNDGLFSFDGSVLSAVVVSGQASPVGGSFSSIGNASLNDGETWVFRASVSTKPASGIFRADAGNGVPQVSLVAREGDTVPDPMRGTFKSFPTSLTPSINGHGVVAFRGTVANGASGSGVFVAQAGSPLVVAAITVARNNAAATDLVRLRDVAIANDGSIVIPATISGGSPCFAIYTVNKTVMTWVTLEDATDRGAGFLFSAPSVRDTAQNAVFLGQRQGVFVVRGPGVVQTVATLGDAAPGGGTFSTLDSPSAGIGGRVAFHADIAHSHKAGEAIFLSTDGRLKRIARANGGAPGGGDFFGFLTGAIDGVTRADVGRGGVGFQANLERTHTSTGLFLWSGATRPVARGNQRAPGGGRYVGFGTPSVGDAGQVAFVATLTDTVGTSGLALRSGGSTRFLARAGDTTDTRAGGRFQSFDACDVGGAGVAFRAAVSSAVRQGVFLAHGTERGAMALVGDAAPGGGTFAGLGVPVLAGSGLAFQAQVGDPSAASGLYRVSAATVPGAQDPPLAVEPLLVPGGTLPGGGTVLDVGTPVGNEAGVVAATVSVAGGATPTALVAIVPAGAVP
jgi:hypothetical protein